MKISQEKWNLRDENYGPLLPYVLDENVTDINYNGEDVWIEDITKGRYKAMVEEDGKEVPLNLDENFVEAFGRRIADVVSANFNQIDNLLEAETETLRISIVHDSVAVTGKSISIRKTPAVRRLTMEKILEEGYCNEEGIRFLINCIKAKMNVVFCGLPGAGKTELLKFLTSYIPQDEKVITIEDNLEIHYRTINPGSNCTEWKVDEKLFPYTKAIKAALRQNPQWVMLSEARSKEVTYLLEAFSTGLHGLTTMHTDDCRKIPDRIENMMQDAYAAERLENDVYSFINVGVLLRKKVKEDGTIFRYVDQICLFDRVGEKNMVVLLFEDGKFISKELPANIKKKFSLEDILDPFNDTVITSERREEDDGTI